MNAIMSTHSIIAANVNPITGLATDYLNVFNEYVMLAEMVEAEMMPHEVLADWQPRDYESHFVESGLAHTPQILAAYRNIDHTERMIFEVAVNALIETIEMHRDTGQGLDQIRTLRDDVAALIAGEITPESHDLTRSQDAIDALFD